jgi:DNA topoisomerase-6 subunit B
MLDCERKRAEAGELRLVEGRRQLARFLRRGAGLAKAPGKKTKAPAKPGHRVSRPQLDLFERTETAPAKAAARKPAVVKALEPPAAAVAPAADAPRPPAARPGARTAAPRATAESLAQKQREISVSEFFVKNRHLLGFDNPQKALLTAVRECVDNSLDACGEAGILPTLRIHIEQLAEDRFRVAAEDNGPGIVRKQIPRVFGKLLYGSKFHTLKQQRGQQGIGVSAAGMYGQLTTGKPVRIVSRIGKKSPAHLFEVTVDTKRNEPLVLKDETVEWPVDHGTRVEIELEALYKKGRRSVDDYVEQTALANPHAEILYTPPKQEAVRYARAVSELPEEPKEIRPHPYGVELGRLMRMLQDTPARHLSSALKGDFSRVTDKVVAEVCQIAQLRPTTRPRDLATAEVERLHRAFQSVRIMAPPTNCLSPIGEEAIVAGLKKRMEADYYEAVTRPPAVYRGNPFQVEVGLAYGGKLPADELVELYRFANRVPLQYQASACAITKAAMSVDWRSYGLQMSKGALPTGPMVVMIHIASVWVPFTSESKEAIAHYPEIVKELRLALMEVGRRLSTHIRHRRRSEAEAKKRSYIDKFIPHIGIALREILALSEKDERRVVETLRHTLERSREALG